MRVAFRVDASVTIGTGHVMRCLTLASELRSRGAVCDFVCREHKGALVDTIRLRGFSVFSLPVGYCQDISADNCNLYQHWLGTDWQTDAEQTINALKGSYYDWLVIDHYAIDEAWEKCLKNFCQQIMVIDDLANRRHVCDLLLDQNWLGDTTQARYSDVIPHDCVTLLGPEYALLDSKYAIKRQEIKDRSGDIHRILVFMGGSDPSNETAKVLQAVSLGTFAHQQIDVVIGANHPYPAEIQALVENMAHVRLHQGLPSLVDLMGTADLMIGAGGATTWERMSLGLPAIVISIASNQVEISKALADAGLINYLGEKDQVTSVDISHAINACILFPSKMQKQSEQCKKLVAGIGVTKVADMLCARV